MNPPCKVSGKKCLAFGLDAALAEFAETGQAAAIARRCHGLGAALCVPEAQGIQALALTTPARPPVPGQHPSHLRDYEYKRLGTVSLWAGLDLHTGTIIETVSDSHKSADFIAFLKKLDTYLVRDGSYLDTRPQRFVFVFTPTHGSWLHLIENQFSKDDWFHVRRNPRS